MGPVPTGFDFVPWSSVSADDVWGLVPGAAALVVVGFAQSIAVAKALAVKHGREVDASQELVGYGAANLGAGILQGYSVTGSLSKSAASEKAGGRTPVLLLVTAGLVLLTILFLAGVFEKLPEPALAAIVINAVWGMIEPSKVARLARVSGGEFVLAAGATAGVLLFDILGGIVVGVILSFMLLIRRIDRPRVVVLGRDPGGRPLPRCRPPSRGDGDPGRPHPARRRADRLLERRRRGGAPARRDRRVVRAAAAPWCWICSASARST